MLAPVIWPTRGRHNKDDTWVRECTYQRLPDRTPADARPCPPMALRLLRPAAFREVFLGNMLNGLE